MLSPTLLIYTHFSRLPFIAVVVSLENLINFKTFKCLRLLPHHLAVVDAAVVAAVEEVVAADAEAGVVVTAMEGAKDTHWHGFRGRHECSSRR